MGCGGAAPEETRNACLIKGSGRPFCAPNRAGSGQGTSLRAEVRCQWAVSTRPAASTSTKASRDATATVAAHAPAQPPQRHHTPPPPPPPPRRTGPPRPPRNQQRGGGQAKGGGGGAGPRARPPQP